MFTPLETFSLALRINNQQLKFTIHIDDTQESLFQKLVEICPQCKNRKTEVLSKLKHDLEGKLKSNSVNPDLKQTIQSFLEKTFFQSQGSKEVQFFSKEKVSKSKQLQNLDKIDISQLKKAPQYHPTFKKSSLLHHQSKQRPQDRAKSQKKREGHNQDVIKACQIIFQKSNQNDMKEMAKNYLQEIGRYPFEEKRKDKIVFMKEEEDFHQPIIPNQPEKEQLISQHASQTNKIDNNMKQSERSPIQIIQKSPQYLLLEEPSSLSKVFRLQSKEKRSQIQHRSIKNNKYNYLASLQNSFVPLEYPSSFIKTLNNSRNQVKRFSYLSDLSN